MQSAHAMLAVLRHQSDWPCTPSGNLLAAYSSQPSHPAMRLHSTRAPDARAAWRTGLAALACSLGLTAVLLGGRLLPAAGGLCRAGGTGAGAQADAAPPGGSPARLQQPRPPPANNKTSLLVVLARHEEDIRWWMPPSCASTHQRSNCIPANYTSVCVPANRTPAALPLLAPQGGPAARSGAVGTSAANHHLPDAGRGGGMGARLCRT